MSFSKLAVEVYRGKLPEPVELFRVLFNPNRITWEKQVPWNFVPRAESNASVSEFTHGQPSTLNLDLFFDTYQTRSDVSRYTSKIYQLTAATGSGEEEEPPPLLRLRWGLFNFHDLYWVLTQVNQQFTLFLEDGTPVRATLGCTFQEKQRSGPLGKEGHRGSSGTSESHDLKSHVVKGGETLSAIHARHTGDPADWRRTARANQIWNPRRLETGTPLLVTPSFRHRRGTR